MNNNPMEHTTGIKKRELLLEAIGDDNPFDMKVFKRGACTKENPNLIPSAFDARVIGCEEDQTYVQWMWQQKGNQKRFECGNWFKLVEKAGD